MSGRRRLPPDDAAGIENRAGASVPTIDEWGRVADASTPILI